MMFADLPQRLAMHCLRRIAFIVWGAVLNLGSAYATYVIGYTVAQFVGLP